MATPGGAGCRDQLCDHTLNVINYVITHRMPTYNWLETAVHDQHVGFKIQFNSTGGDNSTKFN